MSDTSIQLLVDKYSLNVSNLVYAEIYSMIAESERNLWILGDYGWIKEISIELFTQQ